MQIYVMEFTIKQHSVAFQLTYWRFRTEKRLNNGLLQHIHISCVAILMSFCLN